ncbi:MAG: hypothetical protein JOY72_08175 [Actinobacteria bacterium]|nr:hypothetical protein [Actinomycetota bacterium]
MRRFVLPGLLVCLVVPAAANAGRVGWNETAKVAGKRVMTYRVDTLSVGSGSWTAHVSFKNISSKTIKVGSQFGLAFYLDPKAEDLTAAVGFAQATKFSTPTPTTLKPGESWTGEIGGSGSLSSGLHVYARVVFGPFTGVPGESSSIVWITDHRTTVDTNTKAPPTATGPVI